MIDPNELEPGYRVQIEWQGTWWAGEVVAVNADGTVRIHYDGYDSSSDETVTLNRLRPPTSDLAQPPGAQQAPQVNPGPSDTDPLRALLSSRPVTAETPLKPGERLQVEWGGNWWAGEVIALERTGEVRIHYIGWASSYDETVARSRLMLPTTGPVAVSVFLDNSQTVSGTLLGSAGDFLVLRGEGETGRTLVNKRRIMYVKEAGGK